MTAEQLQRARASAWHQQGNALLTADDAAAWLREAGLALFLPRPAQVAAPAPSFVEATSGEGSSTPLPRAITNATELVHRLLAAGDAIALNLLGSLGDQPDYLATAETLPFLFALRGDREWKRGPRGKSSPLVVEVWKQLDRDGALTADEIKDRLGRQLTESAALRALTELWTTLRVEPIYPDPGTESTGGATRWQLLEMNHEKAMTAGSAMAQGMALSALVSLYLQSAIAATGEEIESFLSPVASRSKVRDAVRGLLATHQLGLRNLGADEHFFVEGSLPEFETSADGELEDRRHVPAVLADMLPEIAVPVEIIGGEPGSAGELHIEALSEAETERERTVGEGRKRFVAQRNTGGERKSFAFRSGSEKKPFSERKGFSRAPGSASRAGAGANAGRAKETGERRPFFAREPWKEDQRPVGPGRDKVSTGGTAERPSRPAAAGSGESFPRGARKPFGAGSGKPFHKDGERRPFVSRGGGEATPRKPFTQRPGERPVSGNAERRPFAPQEGSGDRKPFVPRQGGKPFPGGGERKPFAPRKGGPPSGSGNRKPFPPREGGQPAFDGGDRKPFTSREGARPSTGGGDRKPFTPREGGRPGAATGDRKPFSPRPGGAPGRRAFPAGAGQDRRPFQGQNGGGGAFSREEGRPFRRDGGGEEVPRRTGAPGAPAKRFPPAGGRPSRPGAPAGTGRPGGKRPRTSPFTSSGKPRPGVGATGRPGPRTSSEPGPGSGPRTGPRATRPAGAGPRKPPSGRKPGGRPGDRNPRRDG